MSYYELAQSLHQTHAITVFPRLPGGVSFPKGVMIQADLPDPLVFETDNDSAHPPDDFPGSVIHVLSDRFVEALRAAGVDNMQTFPAQLQNPASGDVWPSGLQAVNFVGVVDCVDLEKSDYDEVGVGVLAFRDVAISESRAGGLSCFRLMQSPDRVVLAERVVDAVLEQVPDLTGASFEELIEAP